MKDYLIKALAFDGQAIVYVAKTTNTVKKIVELQKTLPAASAALGRTASIASLMASQLKGQQKLTITVAGDGPIGKITVDAHADLTIRGFVDNPLATAPSYYSGTKTKVGKLNVAGVVGSTGYIQVVKDIGMRDFFVGKTEIISGEIAEDFAYYFAKSEQINSVVAAGVLVEPTNEVSASGAYMIQLLPGATEKTIINIEKVIESVQPISEMIRLNYSPENILDTLIEETKIIENRELQFKCTCSKDRFKLGIMSLGRSEVSEMIAENDPVETHCHFCNQTYMFSIDELQEIVKEIEDAK